MEIKGAKRFFMDETRERKSGKMLKEAGGARDEKFSLIFKDYINKLPRNKIKMEKFKSVDATSVVRDIKQVGSDGQAVTEFTIKGSTRTKAGTNTSMKLEGDWRSVRGFDVRKKGRSGNSWAHGLESKLGSTQARETGVGASPPRR
jgi:hypothetical protein